MRAAQHLLLWIGIGIALQLGLAQEGFLLANGRDGTASLLEWWSPRWELWSLVPSFIHHEAGTAIVHSLTWLAIAAACAIALRRLRPSSPGSAALAAWAVLAAGLAAAAMVIPSLPADPPQRSANLQARARVTALDTFDATARPAALVYDPFHKAAAVDQVSRFTLSVAPGLRPDPQPLRVVHNGRFSLPAGRYRVEIQFTEGERPGPLPLSLQLGRTGLPVATWTVDAATGPWTTEFALPVDVGFVGFRSSRELERAIRLITLTPLAVEDLNRRPRVPQVLAAGKYGGTEVFFHDDWTGPEPTGFWVLGRRPTRLTFAAATGGGPALIALNLRADHEANHVALRAPGWIHEMDLLPGQPEQLLLPPTQRGVVSVMVETSGGFVPAERDKASNDKRLLGVWIELP